MGVTFHGILMELIIGEGLSLETPHRRMSPFSVFIMGKMESGCQKYAWNGEELSLNTSTPVGSSRRHIGNELLATGKLTFCLRTFSRVAKKRPLFEGRALCHMFPSNVYFLIHSCYVRFTRAVSQRSDVNSHLCLSFTFFVLLRQMSEDLPWRK